MTIESSPAHPARTGPVEDRSRMPLAGHLEELRRRLGVSLAAFLVACGIGMTQVERILGWLRRPAAGHLPQLAFFSPSEPLFAYMKIGLIAGLMLAMPVILWQLWVFIRSGLTRLERRYGLVFVWWGSAQFLAGAAFAYYVVLPVSLHVLLGIGDRFLTPVISIDRYLAFVTTLIIWCGVVFELPVILWVLTRVGIVTPEWLRQSRPYAVLVLVIIAALVTPTTDPVNLLLMSAPMVVLYELSIWVTRVAMPRRVSASELSSPRSAPSPAP